MQLDLLSYCEAAALRDRALAQIESNNQEWADLAFTALEQMLPSLPREFLPEAIKVRIVTQIGQPSHFNCWGSLFMKAIKRGLIEKTGHMGQASSAASHKTAAPFYRWCDAR